MKLRYRLKLHIKRFLTFCIFLLFSLVQINLQEVIALPMKNEQSQFITEELRLKVPALSKDVWLKAEKKIWEPWLSSQDGFLGRQIFWNKDKEEALILVSWQSKKLWKSISTQEVNELQEQFESNVIKALNVKENPFKLIYEGELAKQR